MKRAKRIQIFFCLFCESVGRFNERSVCQRLSFHLCHFDLFQVHAQRNFIKIPPPLKFSAKKVGGSMSRPPAVFSESRCIKRLSLFRDARTWSLRIRSHNRGRIPYWSLRLRAHLWYGTIYLFLEQIAPSWQHIYIRGSRHKSVVFAWMLSGCVIKQWELRDSLADCSHLMQGKRTGALTCKAS